MGLRAQLIGDSCLLLGPYSHEKEDRKVVAVNVAPFHEKIWGNDHRKVLIEMIRVQTHKKDKYHLILIARACRLCETSVNN